jgi:hypothetical protein
MKKLLLYLLNLILPSPKNEITIADSRKGIRNAYREISFSSTAKAKQREQFEESFEFYLKASDFMREFNKGRYPTFTRENIQGILTDHTDEALKFLPDEFIQEIELLKLQIQAK